MKLTSSIVVIAALSGMSFAGGMIMEPAYENEVVEIPVEPIPEPVVEAIPEPKPEPKKAVVIKEVPKPKVVVAEKPAEPSGLYIAGGLTDVAVNGSDRANLFGDEKGQDRQVGFTGILGYNFMEYLGAELGAELRGTYGIAKDNGNKFKQLGAYFKPSYKVTDEVNLYALAGLSKTNVGVGSDTGFSYGAGVDYKIPGNDKVSVFTDVVNYMKKSNTASQWGLTLGAAYQF